MGNFEALKDGQMADTASEGRSCCGVNIKGVSSEQHSSTKHSSTKKSCCPFLRWRTQIIFGLLLVGFLIGLGIAWQSWSAPPTYAPPAKRPLHDAPFVPTPHDIVAEMLKLAEVGPNDVVYDLGCGDGRIVIAAAKTYGCKAVGVDKDPKRIAESRANAEKEGVQGRVQFIQDDIFNIDLSPATVVTLYLLPQLNNALVPQIEKMKPGSRIVSHDFDIDGVKPQKVLRVESEEDHREHTIYLWVTPLKKIGEFDLP